jgi:hypothetical protein
MAITYVGSGTFTAGTGAITPPFPSGIQANDIALLVCESENQAISLSTANGFVELGNQANKAAGTAATDPASRLAVFWKRLVGGDAAPTVADSGDHTTGQIHVFRGVRTTGNPWDVFAEGNSGGTNSTSASIPGATTTVDNCLVVLLCSTSFNGTSTAQFSGWTNPDLSNLTERTDNSNTAGLGGGHGMATGLKATAGTYGATTVTLANTSFKGTMSIALAPQPDPQTLTPAVVTAGWSAMAPTVTPGPVTMTPTAVQAAWSVLTPTVSAPGGAQTLNPTVVSAAWSLLAPAVARGPRTLTPTAAAAAWSVLAPALVKGSVTLTPSAAAAAWSLLAPTLTTGQKLTPAAVSAAWSLLAPSVLRGSKTLAPAVVAAAWTTFAPSVVRGPRTVTPSVTTAAWSVLAASLVRGPRTMTPTVATAGWSVQPPTVTTGPALVQPPVIVATFIPLGPTVSGGEQGDKGKGGPWRHHPVGWWWYRL